MWTEYKTFLIKDNIIGLAIAVILGMTLNKLVGSIVDDLIMPLIGLVAQGDWQEIVVPLSADSELGIGRFLAALVNFFIVGFVCWRIAKAFVRPEPAKS